MLYDFFFDVEDNVDLIVSVPEFTCLLFIRIDMLYIYLLHVFLIATSCLPGISTTIISVGKFIISKK